MKTANRQRQFPKAEEIVVLNGDAPTAQALREAIADLYLVMSRHSAPKHFLNVCTGCCMSAEDERAMRELPLREITARLVFEYNDSAKDPGHSASEVLYFMPRIAELLAQGASLRHSTEITLDRMGISQPETWTADERECLQRFALAFFSHGLSEGAFKRGNLFQGGEALDVLVMFSYASLEIEPLLESWLAFETPPAVEHFVASTWLWFWPERRVGNSFGSDRPEFNRQVTAALLSPLNLQAAAAALVANAEMAYAPLDPPRGRWDWPALRDWVFDHVMDALNEQQSELKESTP